MSGMRRNTHNWAMYLIWRRSNAECKGDRFWRRAFRTRAWEMGHTYGLHYQCVNLAQRVKRRAVRDPCLLYSSTLHFSKRVVLNISKTRWRIGQIKENILSLELKSYFTKRVLSPSYTSPAQLHKSFSCALVSTHLGSHVDSQLMLSLNMFASSVTFNFYPF